MAKSLFKRIFGDPNQREIAHQQKVVQEINALESQFQELSAEQLHAKTAEFRDRFAAGETLDELLTEAFAAVREASKRTIGLRHYDVQLIGGIILHQGKVVEMRTGEGKTLVATLPLYLNALESQGTHLVTPNDYLAKFGVQWMGPVYHALGMSISVIQSGGGLPDKGSFLYDPEYTSDDDRFQYLRPITRQAAYRADITYGTNNEFGFDYLRDNMVVDLTQCTQRAQHYAIIDEVDSILIDEARTPLIISGTAGTSSELYKRFAGIVPRLHQDTDYEVDVRTQITILTDEGVARVEQMIGIPEGASIYDPQHANMLPYLDNALRAKEFFRKDTEYVIRDGEIIIVDQFTGRMMFGRRYSEGLHQAIEAKEHVDIRRESLTYATITFQNFFRMYDKLGGMTGTAATEAEELHKIYALEVVILPTNIEYRASFGNLVEEDTPVSTTDIAFAGVFNAATESLYTLSDPDNVKVTLYDGPDGERYYRRLDLPDQIYGTEQAKFKAVIQEITAAYQASRPVLVGTTAIETSERLSKLLKARKIPHNILNAKYHEKEAVYIAQAGRPAAITIATNMAGRGVDILLGGNAEGLARDQLRQEGVDLTQINSVAWETALKMARHGENPQNRFPERWTQVLWKKVQQCAADRQRIYQLGGLHVIGTERHEARRIDNQLRGRAGRQGDPGSSRFYISLEDEIMRRFGGERLQPWMERAGLEDAPLEFKMLAKAISSIQERVEGYNFDIRKHVLEYDNVVSKQREVIYAERRKILSRDDLQEDMFTMVAAEIRKVVTAHTGGYREDWDLKGMLAELRHFTPVPRRLTVTALEKLEPEELVEQLMGWAEQTYREMNQRLGAEAYRSLRQEDLNLRQIAESHDAFYRIITRRIEEALDEADLKPWRDSPLRRLPDELETQLRDIVVAAYRLFRDRQLLLRTLDDHWVRHLTNLDVLREGIGLRAIGKQNPLVAYQKEAYDMYLLMLESVQQTIVRSLFLVPQQTQRAARRPGPTAQRRSLRAVGGSAQAAPPPQTRPRPGTHKLGRNNPCWCGSGKKYKSCHWRADHRAGIVRYVSQ